VFSQPHDIALRAEHRNPAGWLRPERDKSVVNAPTFRRALLLVLGAMVSIKPQETGGAS